LGNAENAALRRWASDHGLNIPDKKHIRQFGELNNDQINSLLNMIDQAAKSGCCK